ncbi:putative PPPDE putative peptidase domain-containing protein [Helianthus annuus]|nr:putative PPPDE peptidase domain, PPPDE putative peptidase domain superfamily [Helianthus annuus]KAJ0891387.1 putative PPPDE putative peptidase domain-containing protein [Helianthus annuus]
MGRESLSSESRSPERDYSNMDTQVFLNVYDLTPVNSYSIWFGFGIFHSGIQVYGMEYGFGAHDFPISGVFEVEPKTCPGFIYRCSIPLGHVSKSPTEFREFIETVASEYHGDTYHLISKNCNHFTDDITQRLTGKNIPGWVNRLAKLGAVCSCLLPENLQVTAVKQPSEYHNCEEDGTGSVSSSNAHEPLEYDDDDEDDAEEEDKHLLSAPASSEVAFVKEVV